ncbi:hypothetical protein L1887_62081 [Cichorium endivia]|nr:hypothetical protein L1887_62081 [Cichorium endivia]
MKRPTDLAAAPLPKRPNTEAAPQSITDVDIPDASTTMSSTTAAAAAAESKDFFKPIGEHVADGDQPASTEVEQKMVDEIESLCMDCHKQGTTRMLLTYIPYFREVIVVSFSCPHCGNRNSEIQSAGQIQTKGCLYTVHVTNPTDLNRQVVKSEHCTITIPELQIEIPPKKGQLTTIEGVVSDTLRDLELDQPLRKHMQPEAYAKIEEVCDKLRNILGEEKADEEAAAYVESNTSGLRSLGPVGGSTNTMSAEAKAERKVPPLLDQAGRSVGQLVCRIHGRRSGPRHVGCKVEQARLSTHQGAERAARTLGHLERSRCRGRRAAHDRL